MFRFRSVNSIVIAAARTGKANSSIMAVISTDQTNRGILNIGIDLGFMLIHVVIKLIAPRMEEAPARCKEKIARSTDGPECTRFPDSGG